MIPSVLRFASAFILSSGVVAVADARPVSGRVVDPEGRPVPRALVRVTTDTAAHEVFTSLDGTFTAEAAGGACRVVVSLTGFTTAVSPCDEGVRITLTVAPVTEAIIVTATRSEAPASQTAASVTVFSAEDLNRRLAPPVADLLSTAPGVTVSRSGGYGNVTSVYIRGGESNHTKVLVDGIPVNEPGGTFNYSNITSENLERVEIVRGAHSALFGSDAMAGVVQLFTRTADPGAPPRVGAALEAGSFGTFRARSWASGAAGRFDYSGGAAYLTTDNREPNNEFRNNSVSAAAGFALTPRARLRGVFRGEFGTAGVPGQTAFGRPDLDAFFERDDVVAGVTLLHDGSAAFRHRLTYGFAITHQDSINLDVDPPYTPSFGDRVAPFEFSDFPYHSRNRLRRHHGAYQADWTVAGASAARGVHQVTGAVDWDGERGTLEDVLAATATEFSRDNVGVSLQHQASWPRVFATAGLRVERNESFGRSTAPRLAVAVVLRRGGGTIGETRVRGSAGKGIKEPTALQTFSASPFFRGNPDLRPERSRTFELAFEQRFASERARVEAVWFDNRFRDIIATRTISFSPFVSQFFNIGLTDARGLELTGTVAAGETTRIRAGYALLDSEVVESQSPTHPVFGVGNWLFRRPRHSGFAEAAAAYGRLSLSLAGTFVGRRVDSDFSSLVPQMTMNDPYARWDATVLYRVTRRLGLTFAVDNLAGSDHMEPLGYRTPGRGFRAGARTEF